MTTTVGSQFSLTDDELQVIASRAALDELPTVLAVRPRHSSVDALHAAYAGATKTLVARKLIADGLVTSELAVLVWALHRPDRELAMRVVTPDGISRVSTVRRGPVGVLGRRVGDDFVLRATGHEAGLREATQAILAELPQADPARIEPVGAPLDAMTECLNDDADPQQLADRIHALGADRRAAMQLGWALSSRLAFAEIVYYPLAEDEGRISRFPAAVSVFYTKRGRIVAATSASPAGELWITLKPGSDHAITQAIGQLVELSAERWEDA